MHIVAAFELEQLALADGAQIDFHQGVDGDAEIFREGYQSLDVRFRNFVLVAAQGGAFHVERKGHIVLCAVAVLAEESDIVAKICH